jgi:ABC-type Na+ efflux pump permease subunit
LLSPRLALFVLFLFTDLLSRAFDSWIVPLLGFFLLPWTTLAYAAMWASSDGVNGFEWFIVVLAFLIDVGAFAGGGKRRRETA